MNRVKSRKIFKVLIINLLTSVKVRLKSLKFLGTWAHNPKAVGSSPTPATKKSPDKSGLFYFAPRYLYSPRTNPN